MDKSGEKKRGMREGTEMKRSNGHRHASVNIRNGFDKIETVKCEYMLRSVHYFYNILHINTK